MYMQKLLCVAPCMLCVCVCCVVCVCEWAIAKQYTKHMMCIKVQSPDKMIAKQYTEHVVICLHLQSHL